MRWPDAPSPCTLHVPMEPYHPAYFMINGRSMPDDMDSNYAVEYPHQPYNGNPHMHPGEHGSAPHYRPGTLAASIPRARQPRSHPGRDGNLILTPDDPNSLAGPRSSPPPPRRAGHGWDLLLDRQRPELGCVRASQPGSGPDPNATLPCTPGCKRLQHRQHRPRSTISSGARITTSRCEASPFRRCRRTTVRLHCPTPTYSSMAHGSVAARTWAPMQPRARAAATGTDPALRVPRSPEPSPQSELKQASPLCGTPTMSVRSQPTTRFPGE